MRADRRTDRQTDIHTYIHADRNTLQPYTEGELLNDADGSDHDVGIL